MALEYLYKFSETYIPFPNDMIVPKLIRISCKIDRSEQDLKENFPRCPSFLLVWITYLIICIQSGESCDLLSPESHLHFFFYLACVSVSLSVTCASVLFAQIPPMAKKWKILKYCNFEDVKQPKFISFFQVSDYGHILLKFPKLCIVRR